MHIINMCYSFLLHTDTHIITPLFLKGVVKSKQNFKFTVHGGMKEVLI